MCGVSEFDLETSALGRPKLTRAVQPCGKKKLTVYTTLYVRDISSFIQLLEACIREFMTTKTK